MKLADLKRLPVGTKLLLVNCLVGPVPPEKQPREILHVHSNHIKLKRPDSDKPSYLTLPSAKQFRDDGDGFTIFEDDGKGNMILAAQYKFAQ